MIFSTTTTSSVSINLLSVDAFFQTVHKFGGYCTKKNSEEHSASLATELKNYCACHKFARGNRETYNKNGGIFENMKSAEGVYLR